MGEFKMTVKRPSSGCDAVCFSLLNSITVIHVAHFRMTGPGSDAAHRALGGYYTDVEDIVDSVIEQYQGITGKLMDFPEQAVLPRLSSASECVTYLKELRGTIDKEQATLPYSEINNLFDEIKSLIDLTCYKLIFLK
jgi:hypothetical protein